MRRAFGTICISFLLVLAACAKPAAAEGPPIWRIRAYGSEIWLFGTVHILPPTLKWESQRIDDAFDKANTIFFETPTDAAASANILSLVKTYGLNPPGVVLSGELEEADRAKLNAVCKRVGVDAKALEGERPWLAALQISVAYAVTQGQAATAGVEHVLDTKARNDAKAREFFETGEEQIRFFADLPHPVEVGFLRSTLSEIQDEDENMNDMDEAWARGDVKKLAGYLDKMTDETNPEVYAALIRDRNRRWADKIDAMMHAHRKVFIAVGAAHLIGKDSVTALLRQKGYAVDGP